MRSASPASLLLFACCFSPIEGFSIRAATPSTAAATPGMASTTSKTKRSDEVPSALVEHAVAWAATNGLGMVVNEDTGLFTSTHVPFSLLPYGEFLFLSFLFLITLRVQTATTVEAHCTLSTPHESRLHNALESPAPASHSGHHVGVPCWFNRAGCLTWFLGT